MLDKIFRNDEIKKELLKAKNTIAVLEERLDINEKHMKIITDENYELRNNIRLLKEEIIEFKNTPNQFGRVSRATDSNLNILKELRKECLSYSAIARKDGRITSSKVLDGVKFIEAKTSALVEGKLPLCLTKCLMGSLPYPQCAQIGRYVK